MFERLIWWVTIILPLVKTVALPLISHRVSTACKTESKSQVNALLLAASVDLSKIEVSGRYLPETGQALRKGDANSLLAALWKEFFSSGAFKRIFETALKGTIAATPVDVRPVIRDANGSLWAERAAAGRPREGRPGQAFRGPHQAPPPRDGDQGGADGRRLPCHGQGLAGLFARGKLRHCTVGPDGSGPGDRAAWMHGRLDDMKVTVAVTL